MSTTQEINAQRVIQINQKLNAELNPSQLNIVDESHLHAGHAGAKTGKGHFFVDITSDRFAGISPVKTHQLIYAALGEMMQTDIHALRISAKS